MFYTVEPIIAMNRLTKPIDQGEFNICEQQASNTESRTKELKTFLHLCLSHALEQKTHTVIYMHIAPTRHAQVGPLLICF
jgi:hypothetical protein